MLGRDHLVELCISFHKHSWNEGVNEQSLQMPLSDNHMGVRDELSACLSEMGHFSFISRLELHPLSYMFSA